jgi:hypothetical protein
MRQIDPSLRRAAPGLLIALVAVAAAPAPPAAAGEVALYTPTRMTEAELSRRIEALLGE